jgi:hypothetical protein
MCHGANVIKAECKKTKNKNKINLKINLKVAPHIRKGAIKKERSQSM